MAIISVKQVGPGRSATAKLNGRKEVRTHTQPWRVICNSPYDTSYEVQAAFPAIGTQHPNDQYAFLISKDPTADSKSKMIWMMSLVYSTERPRSDNPSADPVDIEWDSDVAVEALQHDADGQPMLNTAGDQYGEAIKGDKATWTAVCTSNQIFIPAWIDDYKNAINSDYCSIDGRFFSPGQCKIKKIHISRWQTREEYRYRVLTITVKITDNPTLNVAGEDDSPPSTIEVYGWNANVIDEGLQCLIDDPFNTEEEDNQILVPCTDDHGKAVRKPAALDGQGGQLRGTGDSGPPTADQIVYNSFKRYKLLPFSFLPLN